MTGRIATAAAAAMLALAAAGCARDIGGATVDASRLGAAVATERGVVESVRVVQVRQGEELQDNVLGGAVGGVAGGLAGSQIGAGRGQVAATVGGVVAGAAVGAAAQQALGRQTAYEYVVRLPFNRLVTVVQTDPQPIPVGAPVFVQTGGAGQRARVSPA